MSKTTPMDASTLDRPMWRSLAEREGTQEFRQWLEREFPEQASQWEGVETSRRDFLRLMAASFALAGAGGCTRQPKETIVPTVRTPEDAPGGASLMYASAMPMTGGALGVLVKTRDHRPIKIEGNEQHPASLGATDIFAQAAVLSLYDPDRSKVIRQQGQISTWDALLSELTLRRNQFQSRNGRGLRILSPPILSPTLAWQREQLLEEFPEARWHEFEPVDDSSVRAGTRLAFGEEVTPISRLDQADTVLSIDADFLGHGPGNIAYARDFAANRTASPAEDGAGMSRLYVVESTPSLTGARADHRLRLRPEEVQRFVRILASGLGIDGFSVNQADRESVPDEWWDALVEDLTEESRRPLVLAGRWQPPQVQALVHVINDHLGAVGQTVTYVESFRADADDPAQSLSALVDEMRAGEVDSLFILEANPVFTAPADLEFAKALEQVSFSLHVGLEVDETASQCTWHVPALHFLESWGDTRAFDGTLSPIQPLIAPLYGGRSPHQLLNVLLDRAEQSVYETVRDYWRQQYGQEGFEAFWEQSVHDGVFPDTAAPERSAALRENLLSDLLTEMDEVTEEEDSSIIAVFRPHPTIWDGRFANNGWLQELPQPLTKLTWDNAALISPSTATQHELSDGDVVQLSVEERRVEIPVVIVPGQADGVVTLHFGCGRIQSGRVGTGIGTDVYPLRTTDSMWTTRVTLSKLERRRELATTQHHFLMDGRDLVRAGTWDEYLADPEHPPFMQSGHAADELESLYPDNHPQGEYQWGMSIDLTACIGCSACVIACQAENNIPVVGPQEVARGREMHWIRVDTYFEGEPENPAVHHQPVPCMHCEHAPCEVVCPVAATTHSDEGLNEMTYNRCIVTRYCSNNCPYKVRRFNFFDYHEETRETPVLKLLQNPDVTVRSRGVMEKCTYCVQRINAARINAEMEDRSIRDGEVVTACQSVCPTQAIVFGDLSDRDSAVSRQKSRSLDYGLLEELNTRPRTTYLASIRNLHPHLREVDT